MPPSTTSRSKGPTKEEKKMDDASETPAYSAENVQHNARIIYYSRTFLSIVGGVIAGVLGLTAIPGFLFYFLMMILVSGAIAAKAKFNVFSYFDSWQRITMDGITAGFMRLKFVVNPNINFYLRLLMIRVGSMSTVSQSFVLFWTFAYDIVHIF